MKKREVGWKEATIQLCLCITCIVLVWAILKKPLLDEHPIGLFQAILVTITGIGAIGFYIPIGAQVRKAFDWMEKKK